jgi:hypothetical protein
VDGACGLGLDADGTLLIETALGLVRQPAPATWQDTEGGRREPIACGYVLRDDRCFGFSAPAREGDRSLVIDPALLYATFLGGGGNDVAHAVALDASGAATVAGETASVGFPANGSTDAFVARLDPPGSALLDASYLGGGAADSVEAVALDAAGVVTAVGRTYSIGFPTTGGAYDTTLNGNQDAFVVRLQVSTFPFPVMAFPAVQSVPVRGIYGLQVTGPAGATVMTPLLCLLTWPLIPLSTSMGNVGFSCARRS